MSRRAAPKWQPTLPFGGGGASSESPAVLRAPPSTACGRSPSPPRAERRRIAELNDGKRAVWSMLGQYQQGKEAPKAKLDRAADPMTVTDGAEAAKPAEQPAAAATEAEQQAVWARENRTVRMCDKVPSTACRS